MWPQEQFRKIEEIWRMHTIGSSFLTKGLGYSCINMCNVVTKTIAMYSLLIPHVNASQKRQRITYLLITFGTKSCLICCTKQVCWCNLAYITQGPHVSVLGLLVTRQDLSPEKNSLNFNPQYCLSLTVTSKKINLNLDLSSHKICT